MNRNTAKLGVAQLHGDLKALVAKDPEQDVQGIALPVLAAALETFKAELADDPVAQTIDAMISPEAVAAGEPIRAADALIVVGQLSGALWS